MRVHRKRAANREIRVALHDLDGEVLSVYVLLDLVASAFRLHGDGFVSRRKVQNAIELAHVNDASALAVAIWPPML